MSRVTLPLVIGTLAAVVGSILPAGHSLGVINTPEKIIRAWLASSYVDRAWDVSPELEVVLWSTVVAAFVAGAALGAAVAPKLADCAGRRFSLFITQFICTVSAILFGVCYLHEYVELMILGRFVAGLSAGMSTCIVTLYISEICPPSLSGVFSALVPLGFTLGMLISYIEGFPSVLGNECSWIYLMCGSLPYVGAGFFLLVFAPESPTFTYLFNKEFGDAVKELCSLRGTSDEAEVAGELAALESAAQRSTNAGSWTIKKIMGDSSLRRLLIFVFLLNVAQQLSGVNAVFYYSTLVYRSAGLQGQQVVVATFCIFLMNVVMSATALPLLRYFRRRALLTVSMTGTIACFIVLVVSLSVVQESSDDIPLLVASVAPVEESINSTNMTRQIFRNSNIVLDTKYPGMAPIQPASLFNNCTVEDPVTIRNFSAMKTSEPSSNNNDLQFEDQMTEPQPDEGGWAGVCALVATVIFVLAYGVGLGPVPYSYAAETFPDGPRSVALAVGGTANWGGNFLVGLLFPLIQRHMQHYSFLLFTTFTLVLLIVFQWLPEPKSCKSGQELAEPNPGESSELLPSR
ncbi:solute carrier family 2, facilitated glucose transporter member 3 [Hyalella azteca]|uniref:Solute carrier family 2, facilitated glucose transporter member 3 n=1 Tax=Hyalella azteca TaxID=294128 RepID=A0A8B7NDX2_HYAAZ|nr:solute carrier family 2, facilitated glucose transporter member 3 [Hyalella azteca]